MVSLKQKGQSGFTIVELLIVIVIIGILAGLVITQIIGATSKARDTERKTDLDQISNQLEAYYAKHGSYPALTQVNTGTWRTGNEFSAGDGAKSFADPGKATDTNLSATVPTATGQAYSYATTPTGCGTMTQDDGSAVTAATTPCTGYTLTAWLENDKKAYTKKSANN